MRVTGHEARGQTRSVLTNKVRSARQNTPAQRMTTLHRRIGTAACHDNHQMAEQPGPADLGDAIWNRAALHGGGSRPRYGDAALSAVLRLHNLVMSGGLLDAVERLADP